MSLHRDRPTILTGWATAKRIWGLASSRRTSLGCYLPAYPCSIASYLVQGKWNDRLTVTSATLAFGAPTTVSFAAHYVGTIQLYLSDPLQWGVPGNGSYEKLAFQNLSFEIVFPQYYICFPTSVI